MDLVIRWNPDKNRWLSETRGITFDEIFALLETDALLESYDHPNQEKYPRQKIFEIEAKGYVWLVPYVKDEGGIFLKTIIPSRKAKKRRNTK
jgi:uncharacterized DUF497 family protein